MGKIKFVAVATFIMMFSSNLLAKTINCKAGEGAYNSKMKLIVEIDYANKKAGEAFVSITGSTDKNLNIKKKIAIFNKSIDADAETDELNIYFADNAHRFVNIYLNDTRTDGTIIVDDSTTEPISCAKK